MDFIPTSSSKTPYKSSTTLRLILKIKWYHFISNEEVLKRAGVKDIELKLVGNRLRWPGHICRMGD